MGGLHRVENVLAPGPGIGQEETQVRSRFPQFDSQMVLNRQQWNLGQSSTGCLSREPSGGCKQEHVTGQGSKTQERVLLDGSRFHRASAQAGVHACRGIPIPTPESSRRPVDTVFASDVSRQEVHQAALGLIPEERVGRSQLILQAIEHILRVKHAGQSAQLGEDELPVKPVQPGIEIDEFVLDAHARGLPIELCTWTLPRARNWC